MPLCAFMCKKASFVLFFVYYIFINICCRYYMTSPSCPIRMRGSSVYCMMSLFFNKFCNLALAVAFHLQ